MPSPLAHGAVGIAAAWVAGRMPARPWRDLRRREVAGFCLIVGLSFLPDADVVPGVLSGDLGRFHNAATNGLAVGLAAAVLAAGAAVVCRASSARFWFGITLASYWMHILMDAFTPSRGVMLLWPFSAERFSSPLSLFEGLHWSEGPVSMSHLWTLGSELAFAVFLLSLVGAWRLRRARRPAGKALATGLASGAAWLGLIVHLALRQPAAAGPPNGAGDRAVPAAIRYRAVWVQDRAAGRDVYALGDDLYLMGKDSAKGGNERQLLRDAGNYSRPMLTDDGETVVYSDRRTGETYALPWGGRKPRSLGPGRALDTWTDPATKHVWVAIGDGADKHPRLHRRIQFVRLDDPSVRRELNATFAVNENNFQFHGDGRLASCDKAKAGCGFVDLETGNWKKTSDGCWASMAPEGPPVVAVLRNGHRMLEVAALDGRERRLTDVSALLDPPGHEVFHPRWTNRRAYMALTGPYYEGGGWNRIGNGGTDVEVHLLEFDADLAAPRAAYRVTKNAFADFYPDVWIAPGE